MASHAVDTFWLNYSNELYGGLPLKTFQKLQDAATSTLTGISPFHPVLYFNGIELASNSFLSLIQNAGDYLQSPIWSGASVSER